MTTFVDGLAGACLGASVVWSFATATSHLARFSAFVATLRDYNLLPRWATIPFAVLIIAILGVAAILAVASSWPFRTLALGLMALAFGSFVVGLGAAGRGPKRLRCGCLGGALGGEVTNLSWTLPGLLAALSVVGALAAFTGRHPDNLGSWLLATSVGMAWTMVATLVVEVSAARSRRNLLMQFAGVMQ